MYIVIMHNDDFTTMDFVVKVLCTVFNKDKQTAEDLMFKVHENNNAIIGTYSLDTAKTKCEKATSMAREAGYPFRVTYEPEDLFDDGLPF